MKVGVCCVNVKEKQRGDEDTSSSGRVGQEKMRKKVLKDKQTRKKKEELLRP